MNEAGRATPPGPVLVTDGEERAALAACRALALAGHAVNAVAKTRLASALWSRSCTSRFVAPDPKNDPLGFVVALAEILERQRHVALVPGSDASLLAISEHRDLLEGLVRLGLPQHAAVERSLDKLLLAREASAVGLDPPPSAGCLGRSEALEAVRSVGYPLVVKPDRTLQPARHGLRQQPPVLVHDDRELTQVLQSFEGSFLLQRFMAGASRFSVGGVMSEHGLIALAVARFDRTWPAHAGAVAFGQTVEVRSGLAAMIEALLRRIGWLGLFELEYLVLDDGRAAAIDLNPRVFGWLTLAVEAGANLPAVWIDSMLGRSSERVTARPGVRYRWEEAELANLVWSLRHGELSAAAAVLRPHRRVVHAHFRLRDPAPLVAQTMHLAAEKGGAVLARRDGGGTTRPPGAARYTATTTNGASR